MTYICPLCHKSLKHKHSLNEHMKTVHRDKAGPATESKPKAKAKSRQKAKQFQVKAMKASKPADATQLYKCGGCGEALNGEVSPCPHCGAELKWS